MPLILFMNCLVWFILATVLADASRQHAKKKKIFRIIFIHNALARHAVTSVQDFNFHPIGLIVGRRRVMNDSEMHAIFQLERALINVYSILATEIQRILRAKFLLDFILEPLIGKRNIFNR